MPSIDNHPILDKNRSHSFTRNVQGPWELETFLIIHQHISILMLNSIRFVSNARRVRTFSTQKQGDAFPKFNGKTKLFINNKFVDAVSGKTFETYNPANGEVIARVADGMSSITSEKICY